jgi:hypothetical protein
MGDNGTQQKTSDRDKSNTDGEATNFHSRGTTNANTNHNTTIPTKQYSPSELRTQRSNYSKTISQSTTRGRGGSNMAQRTNQTSNNYQKDVLSSSQRGNLGNYRSMNLQKAREEKKRKREEAERINRQNVPEEMEEQEPPQDEEEYISDNDDEQQQQEENMDAERRPSKKRKLNSHKVLSTHHRYPSNRLSSLATKQYSSVGGQYNYNDLEDQGSEDYQFATLFDLFISGATDMVRFVMVSVLAGVLVTSLPHAFQAISNRGKEKINMSEWTKTTRMEML